MKKDATPIVKQRNPKLKPIDYDTKHIKAKYTMNQLLGFLDQAIDLYRTSDEISYHIILQGLCEFHVTNWEYYLESQSANPDIIAKFNVLRGMQEQKTISGAMSGKYNPAFSMFLLKSRSGWIEEQHKRRLALDEKKLDQVSQVTDAIGSALNINFTVAEHRTDDQIDRLLSGDN
jgi:hypothetical protein